MPVEDVIVSGISSAMWGREGGFARQFVVGRQDAIQIQTKYATPDSMARSLRHLGKKSNSSGPVYAVTLEA